MTEENDLIHYGKDPVFIYDPNNASNRPVNGVHDNVIKLWKIYPGLYQRGIYLFLYLWNSGAKCPDYRKELDSDAHSAKAGYYSL